MKTKSYPAITLRLRQVAQSIGGGTEFGRRLNLTQSTVSNYLNGRPPKSDFLAEICTKFTINPNWLLLGVGGMYTITRETAVAPPQTSPRVGETQPPTENARKGGNPLEQMDLSLLGEALQMVDSIYQIYQATPASPQAKMEMVLRTYDIICRHQTEGRAPVSVDQILFSFLDHAVQK